MSGILDYARWLELNATEQVIKETFPQDQYVYATTLTDPNYAGSDPLSAYTLEMEWATLIYSEILYRNNQPTFDTTKVLGYYTGTSTSTNIVYPESLTTASVRIPAGMYPGPILPNNPRNVPVTVVNLNFVSGSKSIQRTLGFIQNWEPGVTPGDPTLDERYIEILDPTTSTLVLNLESGPVLDDEQFRATVASSIPQSVLDLGVVRLYARPQTTTTYTLISTGTFTDQTATLDVDCVTANLTSGTYILYAEWPGRRQYIRTISNTASQVILAGYPLDVSLTTTPSPITPIPTTATVRVTATVQVGFPQLTPVSNTTTVRLIPNVRSSAQTTSTTQILSAGTMTAVFQNINSDWLDATLTSSSTYTIQTATLTSSSYIVTATVTTPVTVEAQWQSYRPGRYASGSTSTVTSIVGTKTYTFARQSLPAIVLEQIGNPGNVSLTVTDQTYSLQGPYIQFRSTLTQSRSLSTATVQFRALYTATLEPASFVTGTITTIVKRVIAPMSFLFSSQITSNLAGSSFINTEVKLNLNSVVGINTGSSFSIPGITGTFTVTNIQSYTGELYNDSAVTGYRSDFIPNQFNAKNYDTLIGSSITFTNPDASQITRTVIDQNTDDYRINWLSGIGGPGFSTPFIAVGTDQSGQNVRSRPNRIRLENTNGLAVGDYFYLDFSGQSLWYNNRSVPVNSINTTTRFTITALLGNYIEIDPPWGAWPETYPNNWWTSRFRAEYYDQWWQIAEAFRHKSITFYRDSGRDISIVNPESASTFLQTTYPYRIYVNTVGNILPGSTITYQRGIKNTPGDPGVFTGTVQTVNATEKWIETTVFANSLTNSNNLKPLIVENPTDYISISATRANTPLQCTLLGQSNDQWRFDQIPSTLEIVDTFTVGGTEFPIKNFNTATRIITSVRPSFNITPYLNTVVNFNLANTRTTFNFQYVSDQFGNRVGDGLTLVKIWPTWSDSRPNYYYGWLKFDALPPSLSVGDYYQPDYTWRPNPQVEFIYGPYVENRIRIIDIKHNLGLVRLERPIMIYPGEEFIYSPCLLQYSPNGAFASRYSFVPELPVSFYRYNANNRFTFNELNAYQTVSLGTVTAPTFTNNQLTWSLTTATLNTGTYYVYAEPQGSLDYYDFNNIPKRSEGYSKLLVEPLLGTEFIGKWTPGVTEDRIEAINFETENFEKPITWSYNGTVIGTSTWVRSGTRQISTLTFNTTTISTASLITGYWPGTVEDYRDSVNDQEFTSATITVVGIGEADILVSNPTTVISGQGISFIAEVRPKTLDYQSSAIPQSNLEWQLTIPYQNTTTYTSTFTASYFSTLTVSSSQLNQSLSTNTAYFTTCSMKATLGADPFYLSTSSSIHVFDYTPGTSIKFTPREYWIDNKVEFKVLSIQIPQASSAVQPDWFNFTLTQQVIFFPGFLPLSSSTATVSTRFYVGGRDNLPSLGPRVRVYRSNGTYVEYNNVYSTDVDPLTYSFTYNSTYNQYTLTVSNRFGIRPYYTGSYSINKGQVDFNIRIDPTAGANLNLNTHAAGRIILELGSSNFAYNNTYFWLRQ